MMNATEIAVIDRPRELSVAEVKAQVGKVQELMRDLMKDGTHYGTSYPGDTKKNLLKPGADKLCFMFRLCPDFTQELKELPGGHLEALTRCQIFHIESGSKIAEGVGMASTMESKYRWRNGTRKCPSCGKEAIIKGKEEYGGGFLCFVKKGGCGAKFSEDDPAITGQETGKVENPDIADAYNTVIKMSKKRAYVDATITACAASDIFTQDAEDFQGVTGELAREAVREEPKVDKGNERAGLLDAIGNILHAKDPDGLSFFTGAEIAQERAIAKGAAGIEVIKNQCDRLKKELNKRQADCKPIPYEDEAMNHNADGVPVDIF